MKAIYTLVFFALLFLPVVALCGDHVCTKEEYGTDCVDCKSHASTKNWCVDDNICTKIEKAYNCRDCQKTSGFSGLATFVWSFSALTALGLVIVIFIVLYLVVFDKIQKARKRRL